MNSKQLIERIGIGLITGLATAYVLKKIDGSNITLMKKDSERVF